MKNLLVLLLLCFSATLYGQNPSPVLHCVNKNQNIADIEWSWDGTCGPSFTAWNIYFSNNQSGPWTLLHTIDDSNSAFPSQETSHTDNTVGTDARYYYVESVCGGSTAQSQVVSTEETAPPDLDFATVIDDFSVTVSWQATPGQPKVHGYVIYRATPAVTPIETVLFSDPEFSPPSTFIYTDTNASPGTQAETYTVAAIDSCENVSPYNLTGHTTIFLTVGNDSCDTRVFLDWTDYFGWQSDELIEYIVYTDDGLNVFTQLPPDQTSMIYDLPAGLTADCFRIGAVKNSGEIVTSNKACIDISISQGPEYIYLSHLTVNETNDVQIDWMLDTGGDITEINVLRGESPTDLIEIESIDDGSYTAEMSFIDTDVIPENFAYYYDVESLDSCRQQTIAIGGNIISLQGQGSLDLLNKLSWNAFEMGYSTVLFQELYRVEDNGFLNLITTLPSNIFEFEEQISAGSLSEGQSICYRVGAVYDLNLPNGVSETKTSFSNTFCVNPISRIYAPNAFAPNGINNIFKPVILFPNKDNYQMVVLNRYGEAVFQTTDPDEGWDGTFKGDLAPQGVYAFIISMQSAAGRDIEERGSVLLIR